MNTDALDAQLKIDEGIKQKPYLDCCGKPWRQCTCVNKGKLTIGVGHNLDDDGLTMNAVQYILNEDIALAVVQLGGIVPWWESMTEARQQVLMNMCFNMGPARLNAFKNMLTAMQSGDYERAALEMEDSAWYRQVGDRAKRLVEAMRKG